MSDSRCSGCSLACAVCKILCFSCCRRLCCKPPPPPKPEYAVLCLGYGGAGKSTLLASLCGETETESPPGPTLGFAIRSLITPKAILSIKEIGGSDKIRPYWNRYYSGHEAIIFVVDSSRCTTDGEVEMIKTDLSECLNNVSLKGLPLLVVCNKQDLPTSLPVEQVVTKLNLEELAVGRWYRAVGCSCQDLESLKQCLEELASEMYKGREEEDDLLS